MKLYIAGPMSGWPNYNFESFDMARDSLCEAGHEVISPADMDREIGFDGTSLIPEDEHDDFVRDAVMRNVMALAKCGVEGIFLLPYAHDSKGTRVELAIAELLDLHVFRPCLHHDQFEHYDKHFYHHPALGLISSFRFPAPPKRRVCNEDECYA